MPPGCLPSAAEGFEDGAALPLPAPGEPGRVAPGPPGAPRLPWSSGSSDRSGSTSSSMAAKTEETWSLTSESCTGSFWLSRLQPARWDEVKADSRSIAPREPSRW